jgi:hypothetical protein
MMEELRVIRAVTIGRGCARLSENRRMPDISVGGEVYKVCPIEVLGLDGIEEIEERGCSRN